MTRIRLQAQIMPWEGPESATPRAETRQQGIIKLCVPCLDSLTIQELADKITVQWGRIYIGYGSLDIKELKTIYNERLDMEETVGAYFDDRKDPVNTLTSDEPPSNSIVRVYRFPPDPRELRNTVRFGSLMPESAARPRKRPQATLVQSSRNHVHPAASIELCDDQLPNSYFKIPNKRQRTNEASRSDQPMLSQGYGKEGIHIDLQTSGTQGSIHQVYDSQDSTAGKSSNPYGTPTSLSLATSEESITRHPIDITSIPDSPASRRVISIDETSGGFLNHDRERTKSESPEIELSVHDVLPSEPRDTVKQTHTVTLPPALMGTPYYHASSMQPRPTNLEEDNVSETRDSGIQQHPQDTESNAHSTPRLQEPSNKSVRGEAHHTSNDRRRTSDNIFDMELDVESIPDRQRMHSVKRLKPGLTAADRSPSPHTQSGLSKDPKDGRFLIPRSYKTPQDGVGNPLSELSVPNDDVNADMSGNGIGGTTSYDREERRKIASPNGFDQLRTMPSHCDRSDSEPLQNEKGIVIGKLLSEEEPLVATVSSQVSNLPPKNWSHLDVEHPLKQALSQARRPEFSIPPNPEDHNLSESNECDPQAYGGEGLQKEAEEQKEKDRARERRAEQRRASKEAKAKQDLEENERKRVSDQKTEKRKADETRLAEDKKAKEEKARVEQLADAKGKKEEAARAKAAEEAEAREKRGSDKSGNDGNRIRQQASKEKALAEEAEKTRLRQDGANQLIVEKLQKQKTGTSSPSSLKGAAAKIPRSAGTEEQKARRAEQEAKQRAEQQSKARGPQNWAEALFQFPGSTLNSREHIDTDPEEEKTVTKKVKAKSSGRDCQKLRDSSAHRPSPSESSSTGGHYRKSLTPALPNSTVNRSPSVRGSLKSSSPLASVLSSNLDTPLRSALKHHQTPSALSRSVSFVHDQGEKPAHNFGVSPDYLAVKPIKTLVELNNELALPPPVVSKDSQKATFNVLSTNEASKEKVAKKAMVQQKLNVTKDKKLKGRAVDTPTSSGPAPNEETVLSSSEGDSGSASSPEAVMETGHAEAGPSSRMRPRARPRQEPMARFNLRGTPIDPAIENMGSTTSWSPPHPLPSRASPTSNRSSHRTSVSRSPAQAMSETISVSSGSSSSSQSESEAELESNFASDSVEEGEAVEVESPSSTQSSQPTAIKSDVNTNVARIEIKHSKRGEQGDRSSQQANSSIRYETQNADDQAAGQQLQLESSQPVVPAQIARTGPSSGDGIAPHLKLLNQGLNRDGRLPNGTRPAYFMYPKFTTLRQLQETTIPKEEASPLPALQSFAVSSLEDCEPSNSSSNESSNESSSSISDEDEVEVGPADPSGSPASSKSKPGGFSGMKGVLKLARSIGLPKQ